MSVSYRAVQWTRQKKIYDLVLWASIVFVLAVFSLAQLTFSPNITAETLIIRSTAFTAFLLLHLVLVIGPLCRLNPRFLPLLFNRRHLGVSMFFLALVHGLFSIFQFHALGDTNPILSLFLSNQHYLAISAFPFQVLGFIALNILLLMAATSHDFWLKNLSPKVWKGLHMFVYVAYILIIGHVVLGTLQYENHLTYRLLLAAGFIIVSGLHIFSGWEENKRLSSHEVGLREEGFYLVCDLSKIDENGGLSVVVNYQDIALFEFGGKISAVSNICRHQMGPLGEGRVVDGCITCPWHGYQYLPENGQSPPPFKEKLETYHVKVSNQKVWVNPNPNPPGTLVEPAEINQVENEKGR